MTKSPQEAIIAILIAKLGGEVLITSKDFAESDTLELTRWDDPITLGMRFTSKQPPVELIGEIVEERAELEARG